MALAFGSIMAPAHAVDTRTIIRGEVIKARIGAHEGELKTAYGRITVFAVEERDIARVIVVFNIPEDEMRVLVKLVFVDSVEISSTPVSIVGHWDVYVNGELFQDDTYGIFHTNWTGLGIDIDEDPTKVDTGHAFIKLKGSVARYRYF